MTRPGAEQAVVSSALTVAGVYFFRRLTEPAVPHKTHGKMVGAPAPLGRWVVGYGVAFFVISLTATAAPDLGGWLAILLATGTVLTNGAAFFSDVNQRLNS